MTGSVHTHRWSPSAGTPETNRGVYLVHGIGEHAGRYERFANWLAALGFEVAAHDQPGHGKSAGKRGVLEYEQELVDAASTQFERFTQEMGSKPILFGHSLGGLVATSMVLENNVEASALLLSAPAYAPFISPANKLKLKLLNLVAPKFSQQLPYKAELLTHDTNEQLKGRNDPLNHRYKSASIVSWIVNAGERSLNLASGLNVPTLILVPGNDSVVDANATHLFINRAPEQLITTHLYEGYLHELLNETPDRRERVMADIEQWLASIKI